VKLVHLVGMMHGHMNGEEEKKKKKSFGRPPSLKSNCIQNWYKEKTCRPYSRNWCDKVCSACTHFYAFSPWSWQHNKNVGFLKNTFWTLHCWCVIILYVYMWSLCAIKKRQNYLCHWRKFMNDWIRNCDITCKGNTKKMYNIIKYDVILKYYNSKMFPPSLGFLQGEHNNYVYKM